MKKIALSIAAMFLLALTLSFQPAAAATSSPLPPVQVFDAEEGKIVKTLENDDDYQKTVKSWLGSITGLAPQVKPPQQCKYVIRVPLDKVQPLSIGSTNFNVQDVFLFYCNEKPPLLLVFDTNHHPYLLLFNADIKPFLKKVGLIQ